MKGEHSRAIDMYLKVTPNESEDTQTLANAWKKVCALMSLCITLWNGFHTIVNLSVAKMYILRLNRDQLQKIKLQDFWMELNLQAATFGFLEQLT